MPETDSGQLSAEDMFGRYAGRRLNPVEMLQGVTERIVRLNPAHNAFSAERTFG